MKNKSVYTDKEILYIKNHIDKLNIQQICDSLGKTRKSLFTYLRVHNIKLEDHPNLWDISPTFFKRVKLPEVAYLLGFIWADGTVYQPNGGITIACVKEDMDTLEKVFDKIGLWRKTSLQFGKRRLQRVFRTYNRTLCNWFVSMGYKEKSIRDCNLILKHIPKNLHYMFFRGYFDGDGCIYINKSGNAGVSVAGSYSQDWSSFIELGKELNITFSILRRKQSTGNSSTINLRRNKFIMPFLNYIYQNYEQDSIGLDRKYKKFLAYQKHCEERPLSKTGYIGVVPMPNGKFTSKYCPRIKNSNKRKLFHLGTFDKAIDAAIAYDKMVLSHEGLRARLNFPIKELI